MEPLWVTVDRAATSLGMLQIPPPAKKVDLGTGFSTSLAATPNGNPFLKTEKAFRPDEIINSRFILCGKGSSTGSYLSAATTSSSSSSEHLSLSLGVTVGNAIMSASVSGSFDKAVHDDRSSSKISRRISVTCGSVYFDRPPTLSNEALSVLQSGPFGFQKFCERFGDFYVAGLVLGGDAAILVSQDISKHDSVEKMKLQVKVQVLCFSKTLDLADEDIRIASEITKLNVTAFDSSKNAFVQLPDPGHVHLQLAGVHKVVADYCSRIDRLQDDVESELSRIRSSAKDQHVLSHEQVTLLSHSSLVARLILMPMKTHRDVRPYCFEWPEP